MKWKSWGDGNRQAQFGRYSQYEADYFRKVLNLADVKSGAKILEVGFGNGPFLSFCREVGLDISGTEINPELVDLAKDCGYAVYESSYLESDKLERYDLIIAFDVIEHIDPAKTILFLESCRKTIANDGVLVLRFPNGDSPFSMANFNGDATHCNWIGAEKLAYYSHCAGFKSAEVIGTPQVILTKNLKLAIYHAIVIPLKKLLNLSIRFLFYPGRKLNFVAVDLLAFLKC